MTSGATRGLRACMMGVMLGALVCAAIRPAAAARTPQFPPHEPAGLHDVWLRLDALCDQRKYAEARAICREGYAAASDDETLAFYLRRMGTMWERQGRFDRAIHVFRQVLQYFPSTLQTPWTRLDIASAYVSKAQFRDGSVRDNIATALPLLRQWLRDYPEHEGAPSVMGLVARCYELSGDSKAATREYLQAAERYSGYPETYKCLSAAIVLLQKAGRPSAEVHLQFPPHEPAGLHDVWLRLDALCNPPHDYAEARAICREGYAIADDDETRAFYLRRMGTMWERQGRFDRAIHVFQQVLEYFPATLQAPWTRLDLAAVYVSKARFRQGTPEENAGLALAVVERFLKDYPGHEGVPRAFELRGQCQAFLGNDEAAVAEYLRAVERYPSYPYTDTCLTDAMELLQEMRRWGDVIACGRHYIELYPDRDAARAQFLIAAAYASSGQMAQAVAEFDEGARYPRSLEILCRDFFFHRGLGRLLSNPQSGWDALLAHFAACVNNGYDPRETSAESKHFRACALERLGYIYTVRGRHDLAIAEFERIIADHPDDWHWQSPWVGLAKSYRALGENHKALAALKEAIRRYPHTYGAAEAYLELGDMLRELQRPAEAKAAYKQVVAEYSGVKGCESQVERAQTLLAQLEKNTRRQ